MKKEIEIAEQKKIQINILKETVRVCEENNLIYFLGGGTLLGAVRHQGYIPWDNDIDIMLPRKDYEKLLEIFNRCSKKNYKLLSYKYNKGYYYPFNKIVNINTEVIENKFRRIEELGIYIDVFPIDFLPEENKNIKKIFRYYKFRERIIDVYRTTEIERVTNNKIKLLCKKMLIQIIKKEKIMKKILKQMDEVAQRYDNTSMVACVSGRYMEKEIMPSSYISDYTLVRFEDEEYKIPIGYDEYLTKHYGNYMELPPEEKRIPDHDVTVFWK